MPSARRSQPLLRASASSAAWSLQPSTRIAATARAATSISHAAGTVRGGKGPLTAPRTASEDRQRIEGRADELDDDVVAGAAVEHVDARAADQHVVACA